MKIFIHINGKEECDFILPKDATAPVVGDVLQLIASGGRQLVLEVTAREFIAYFPDPKDSSYGKPNSYGWRISTTEVSHGIIDDES